MILKKMTIEQFGKIKHYDVSFRDQLTLITTPDTDDIVKAIGLATNNKSLLMNQTSKELVVCVKSFSFVLSPFSGAILFSMIAGIACVVYTIDNRGE